MKLKEARLILACSCFKPPYYTTGSLTLKSVFFCLWRVYSCASWFSNWVRLSIHLQFAHPHIQVQPTIQYPITQEINYYWNPVSNNDSNSSALCAQSLVKWVGI